VTKLHGECCSNGFIRGCKFGDVDAYWEKDLNSKTSYSMKEYLTIELFYFILFKKNTMPYVQKAFIITWVYSKLF
jgi:hypothetical protein